MPDIHCETFLYTDSNKNQKNGDVELIRKQKTLKKLFVKNLDACDLKWSMFVAAAQSYRYGSLLKPFPSMYLSNNGTCDIDKLLNIINETPPFLVILKYIENSDPQINNDVINLLFWVLVTSSDISLKSLPKSEFDSVLQKVPSITPTVRPQYIFEVETITDSTAEIKFKKHAEDLSTNFAFHGSKFEFFYSILNFGLFQHLSKVTLFGDGIYLSSEQTISLHYSPSCCAWGASKIGSNISCLAICEYVEHPKYLKCHIKDRKDTAYKTIRDTDIPEKYFIVCNNEIVRVRYLLIYTKNQTIKHVKYRNPAINWITKNKSVVSILCYALFLTSIGVINSPSGSYYRRLIFNRLWEYIQKYLEFS